MRNSLLQRRIPTLLGLLLVGGGIFLSSFFLQKGVLFPTEAGSGANPQNVRISNVSDTFFTLSYTTTAAVIGAVTLETGPGQDVNAPDDRDQDRGTPTQDTVHYITLRDLTPSTKYSYKIVSGGKEYMKDGEPFTFTTPGSIEGDAFGPIVISGKVQLPDTTSAIVYASLLDSQVVSVLTSSDGNFSMSYFPLRSKDFASAVPFSEGSLTTMLITNGASSSKISSSLGTSNPMPIVSLSQDYDFTHGSNPTGEFEALTSTELEGFPIISVDEEIDESVTAEINSPVKDEGFSDQQPQFDGVALPNTEVEVIIHSDQEIKSTVKTNSRGSWTYRPDVPLTPGEHTITIRTRDKFGIINELQQSFVVYAEGSQFTDPSVSPVKSPTPTPSPVKSLSPTKSPAIPPTLIPSPTAKVSLIPTPLPTLVAVISSTPSPPVETPPNAGSPALILSGFAGMVTLSVGLFVLFMSRGGAL